MMHLRLHSINGSFRQKLSRWVKIMVVISQSEFIKRYRINFEISLFRNTFDFNKLQFGNNKREGCKSINFDFLKAIFKGNSTITVPRIKTMALPSVPIRIFCTSDYYFTTHAKKRVLT